MRIELERVTKRYGKVVALDGVSLDIPTGARVALLGANGSGKTTLTRVVMGLVRHDGEGRRAGAERSRSIGLLPEAPKQRSEDPAEYDALGGRMQYGLRGGAPRSPGLAARISYVPQISPPWSAPVGEVIATVAALRGMPAVRVATLAAQLELRLDAVEHRPFRSLSGGKRPKLLVALAPRRGRARGAGGGGAAAVRGVGGRHPQKVVAAARPAGPPAPGGPRGPAREP